MRQIPPADELAEIRSQIARLRAREAELSTILLAVPPLPLHRARPGWPIQRQGTQAAGTRH